METAATPGEKGPSTPRSRLLWRAGDGPLKKEEENGGIVGVRLELSKGGGTVRMRTAHCWVPTSMGSIHPSFYEWGNEDFVVVPLPLPWLGLN